MYATPRREPTCARQSCSPSSAAAALVTAAVAVAAVYTASASAPRRPRFSTDKVSPVRSASCTGADGKAFTITHGRYTGTADLHGRRPQSSTARSRSTPAPTYSTTDGLGYVEGSFRVQDSRHDPNRLGGHFTATLKGSQLVGFLTASARGHHARVLGNLSATFVPATGFTAGTIGSTSSTVGARGGRRPDCEGNSEAEAHAAGPEAARASSRARSRPSVTAPSAARSRSPRGARRPPPAPATPPHRRRPGSPLAPRSR